MIGPSAIGHPTVPARRDAADAPAPPRAAAAASIASVAASVVAAVTTSRRAGTASRAPDRRWTINGDFVRLQPTGVARSAREITLALDALVAEGHPLTRDLVVDVVAPRHPGGRLPLRALPLRVVAEYDRPRLPQLWTQVQLPRHVPGGLVSLCNLAPVAVARHIVCIHDLQTRLVPESYGALFRLAHRAILPLLGRRAAFITTVSEASAEDLARFGVAPREKIRVARNGCDHARRWRPERARLDLGEGGRARPFVLCIGRAAPHKNLPLLVRLAAPLDALGLDLAMAGDVPDEALGGPGERPANLRLLGPVGDDDLAALLGRALCFLMPSRNEGFGLPAVEAMALGCPVVASTAPSLPEVCGDGALYADPDDAEAWIRAVARLGAEPGLRGAMIARGHARAELYSWRRAAETYLAIMSSIDGAR